MHQNFAETREEPSQAGNQGALRFHGYHALVSYSWCEVNSLKIVLASVAQYTISQAVPHLVKLFLKPDELPNRPPISVLLAELVVAARDSISNSEPDLKRDIPLIPFKDEVLGVFTVGLKTASSCQPALAGLNAMVTTPELLTDEELGFIVHNANDILQADLDDGDDARSAEFL